MAIEYVEVVKRVPLWASIPPKDRITEEDLRRRHAPGYDYIDRKIAARLDLFENPGCELATHWLDWAPAHKWGPCVGPVAEGQRRCSRHGGPSALKSPTRSARVAELEAEVSRLQALLEGSSPAQKEA